NTGLVLCDHGFEESESSKPCRCRDRGTEANAYFRAFISWGDRSVSGYIAPRSRARKIMQWLAGVLVATLAIGGFAAPAFAAGGSVTLFPLQSENELNGTPVLESGGTYKLEFGYGSMDDGAVVAISLPDGITIPEDALAVPSGNDGIESLVMNDAGQLVVTFADPFPTSTNQGNFGVNFTVDNVQTSEERELVWSIDGVETSQTVIVTTPGDTPQETTTWSNKEAG